MNCQSTYYLSFIFNENAISNEESLKPTALVQQVFCYLASIL